MNLTNFVNGYLYPFLYDIVHAYGGSDNDVTGLYNFFRNLIDNDLTGLVIPLLAGPMAVWYTLKYSLSTIELLVSQITDWVNANVVPVWNAVISDILYLINWVASAAGFIWNIAVNVFNTLIQPFLPFIDFLKWLYWNGFALLSQLVANTWNWLWSFVQPMINAVLSPFMPFINWLIQLFNAARQFLLAFVQDPVGYIVNLARQVFNALIAPFVPLLQFLNWWISTGGRVLLAFVNNPVQFILDVIAPSFIAWLTQLIANNW